MGWALETSSTPGGVPTLAELLVQWGGQTSNWALEDSGGCTLRQAQGVGKTWQESCIPRSGRFRDGFQEDFLEPVAFKLRPPRDKQVSAECKAKSGQMSHTEGKTTCVSLRLNLSPRVAARGSEQLRRALVGEAWLDTRPGREEGLSHPDCDHGPTEGLVGPRWASGPLGRS